MLTNKRIAVVGSRVFGDYDLLDNVLKEFVEPEDLIISGGAIGADSMAQRWVKENGGSILIHYPNKKLHGQSAPFVRNRFIAEDAEIVLAFYASGKFQQGGTANTVNHARELGREIHEYEESIHSN